MTALNRKGQILGSSITLGWRLFLIAAIALFVALTVGSIFTAKQDVRPAEASVLANRIMNCIAEGGMVEPNFNLKDCFTEDSELYVSANLTSMDSNFSRFIFSGKPNLNVFCNIGDSNVYCMDQKYYVLINNQNVEKGILEIKIGVNKHASNV